MQRKNTLLIFSKVPEAGMTKTRLTMLKDGWFKPEVAAYLYHCMFFDMMETCCDALLQLETQAQTSDIEDVYELVVSTTPIENVAVMQDLFEESGVWPHEIRFAGDAGKSFDEHYNDAFQQAWDAGADCILSMGADMPALTRADIITGFDALHELYNDGGGIALAPDQEMGVSSVGWTRNVNFDHSGVFYNNTGLTVLPAYIQKARDAKLAVRYLSPIPDLDTMSDLMHNITLIEALCYAAETGDNITPPWRTAQAIKELRLTKMARVKPNDLHDPRESIDK